MYLFTKKFWAYSFERMVKTFAQTLIAAITVSAFQISNGAHWGTAAANAGLAALLSLLTAMTAYSAASGTESTPYSVTQDDSSQAETVSLFTTAK